MKTFTNIFNGKTVATTALLMFLGFGLFAYSPYGKGPKGNKKSKKITRSLSADELALYQSVETFYQKNYVKNAEGAEIFDNISKVIVYDLSGNVLQTQDSSKGKIDLSKLPAHAKLLMTENGTQFYVVM